MAYYQSFHDVPIVLYLAEVEVTSLGGKVVHYFRTVTDFDHKIVS